MTMNIFPVNPTASVPAPFALGDDSVDSHWPPPHFFSVDEYFRMAESGVFADDRRVELLEGWIFDMAPSGPGHYSIVGHISNVLSSLIPSAWHVRTQGPLVLSASVPEPDLAVVPGRFLDYRERHPSPADAALVIEVSDSSLSLDRGLKAAIYAAAGISLYWIVDIKQQRVEVLSQPQSANESQPATYRSRQFFGLDAELPLTIDGKDCRLSVAKLFG